MYVCMYVCMYVFIYVCMYVHKQTQPCCRPLKGSETKASSQAVGVLNAGARLICGYRV